MPRPQPLITWLATRGKTTRGLMSFLVVFAALSILASRFIGIHASEQNRAARRGLLPQVTDHSKPSYVPGEILVRFRPGVSEESRLAIHASLNARVLKAFKSVSSLEKVKLVEGLSVAEAIATYRSNPEVLYAEPNYIVHALNTPNDPQFPQQWNLHNTGQNGGTPGADIHAPEVWSLTTGSSSIVVAVIDTGVDYTHPDLAPQIWSAPMPFTAMGDNGVVVNCPAGSRGFNAVNEGCDPMDDNAHGSHVSGILGAVGNNGIGVAGINWNVTVLPCKFLDSSGSGDLSSAIGCLDLVKSLKDAGINIVATNNSWGGFDFSQSLQDAIAAHLSDGILFVAAAGNAFSDNDQSPVYPASFFLSNVISVAATNRLDGLATFSDDGRRTVHLGAPGDQILSTTPNDTYSVFSGTSMAAPHVTGVAALLKAQDQSRDWRAIKNLLLAGGDTISSLQNTVTGKRLNAVGALSCANQTLRSRLLPVADTISATVGQPVTLSALSINCAQPAGPVSVSISPGGQTVTLADDGTGTDQAGGDGIFSGQWTPPSNGSFTLTFPWGDAVRVEVLQPYVFAPAASSYVTISGTNLNLGDDSIVQITPPFPVGYGGGSFSQLYVGSNGTISFTDAYSDFNNSTLPPQEEPPFVIPQPTTLVAPWWQDLFPVKGTAQNVFWEVVGTAPNRELVVEWRDVRSFLCNSDPTATIKFQVVMFEGRSDVQFNYADTVFGGNCSAQDHGGVATVGLQESLDSAQMFSYRGQAIGDGSSILWTIPPSNPTPNPAPTLGSISPLSAVRGGPSIILTVNGTNFVPTSRVQYSGSDRVTTFVSSTVLTAQLDAFDLNTPLSTTVDVFTPGPGGGTSQQVSFTLLNPPPVITSLSPASAVAGGLTFDLTVTGSGFQFGASAIYWNGQPLQSFALNGPNTIFAQVSYGLIATVGTAQITVQTNGPGGGTSNVLPFTISAPQPAAATPSSPIASSPAQIQAKAQHLDLDANGQMHGPAGQGLSRPMRFRGWNYGRQMGPAYFKYFSRPHGGTATPAQSPTGVNTEPKSSRLKSATQLTSSGPGAPVGFGLRPTLPADYIPTSVITGDFNRDGKLDWVVSNGGSNTLWLYLGKGDGTSQLPTILPLSGQTPVQVIAVDLRKIGILDLVVAEADTGTVGVLLGNGNGTFQPEMTFYAPAAVISIAAGDFDGDGKIDIVAGLVGNEVTGPLAFFKGDGTGHFGAPITRPSENIVGSYATSTIQAVDVNKDGLPDLVVTDEGGVVPGAHVYVAEGDGTFKESQYVLEDEAGVLDVLNVAAGDMDGDGCPDVVASTDAGIVFIFKGNCDGTFSGFPNVVEVGAGDTGAGLALVDVNGDGHLDVITSGITLDVGPFGPDTGDSVAVLLGDGKGGLSPGRIFRGEPGMFNLAVGDVNGDGKPDVLTSNQDNDTMSVYLNDGKGGFGDPTGNYIGFISNGVTTGAINAAYDSPLVQDVNGDGKPDIVFLEYPTADPVFSWKLTVLLNDGTGHFSSPIRSDAMEGTLAIQDLQLVDVRGTGKPDLLVLGGTGDVGLGTILGFSPNHGDGTFGPLKLIPLSGTPWIFATGDFDGDGKVDLVIAGQTGQSSGLIDRLTFMKGNGDGTFTPGASIDFGPSATTGGFPRLTFVGDFNNDHKLDLIVSVNDQIIGAGSLPHPVFEFFGNGDGTFQQPVPIFPDAAYLSMADLNHDGQPDLVELVQPVTISGFNTPTYKVHIGQPDGSFKDGQTYAPFAGLINAIQLTGPSPLRFPGPILGDFNGDGNVDIFVPQRTRDFDASTGALLFSRGYFQVLMGNGDGTFTPDYAIFNLDKLTAPTAVADVNADGRADLVEVDPFPSSYNVIPATTGSAIQAQLVSDPVVGGKGVLSLNLGLPPAVATVIAISASDPNIHISSSVVVPAGSAAQNVPFTIGAPYNPLQVFALRAHLGSDTAVAYGTVAQPGASAGFQLFIVNATESTAPGNTTADYGFGITSVNGYATSVQLQCQGLPASATCQFGSNPLSLLPGAFAGTSLTIAVAPGTTFGNYPFTIVASDSSVNSQLSATLGVSDFGLGIAPATLVAFPGGSANYTLTMNSLFGWSQAVQLSCAVTPPGPKCSADGTSLAPGQTTLSLNTQSVPAGNYSVTVSGTGLGVTHNASAQLKIEDATLAVSSTSATIPVGSSTSINVALNSLNGFTDQFNFACLNAPAGVSCSFNPPSAPLPANGSLTSVLTVQVVSRPQTRLAFHPIGSVPLEGDTIRGSGYVLVVIFLLVLVAKQYPEHDFKLKLNAATEGLAVLFLLGMIACGGGSGGGGGGGNGGPPPPPNPVTVVLQVQASSPSLSKVSESITITIP
jgi:subtilisin family serine protease